MHSVQDLFRIRLGFCQSDRHAPLLPTGRLFYELDSIYF